MFTQEVIAPLCCAYVVYAEGDAGKKSNMQHHAVSAWCVHVFCHMYYIRTCVGIWFPTPPKFAAEFISVSTCEGKNMAGVCNIVRSILAACDLHHEAACDLHEQYSTVHGQYCGAMEWDVPCAVGPLTTVPLLPVRGGLQSLEVEVLWGRLLVRKKKGRRRSKWLTIVLLTWVGTKEWPCHRLWKR